MALTFPTVNLRRMVHEFAPRWLRERPEYKTAASVLYAFGVILDIGHQLAVEGAYARMPGRGTPTALRLIGLDRVIRRGPAESDEAYVARLLRWLEDWKTAGNAYSMLNQLRGYFFPTPPTLRIVTYSGIWYTLLPDGTFEVYHASPNNWDYSSLADPAAPPYWSRFWVILDMSAGPWGDGATWGDPTWGDGTTWGLSNATPEDVEGVRQIVEDWRSGHTLCGGILACFDATKLLPTLPPGDPGLPDGWWLAEYKIVAGVAVPTKPSWVRFIPGI